MWVGEGRPGGATGRAGCEKLNLSLRNGISPEPCSYSTAFSSVFLKAAGGRSQRG